MEKPPIPIHPFYTVGYTAEISLTSMMSTLPTSLWSKHYWFFRNRNPENNISASSGSWLGLVAVFSGSSCQLFWQNMHFWSARWLSGYRHLAPSLLEGESWLLQVVLCPPHEGFGANKRGVLNVFSMEIWWLPPLSLHSHASANTRVCMHEQARTENTCQSKT